MVFRFLCIGLGQFLTFAALVLVILANVGQLTGNTVARHIRFVSVETAGLRNALTAAGITVPGNLFATDQSLPIAAGNGIKSEYQWGLYNYCGGGSDADNRDCVDSSFGFQWDPVEALLADAPADARAQIRSFLPNNVFTDSSYLRDYSRAGFYLIFVGTVLTGLSWLTGFLAHHLAFFLAAILAFLAALTLGVGAAINTAIYTRARNAVDNGFGLDVDYGNALWFIWASFVATVLSVVPYIFSCFTGRD